MSRRQRNAPVSRPAVVAPRVDIANALCEAMAMMRAPEPKLEQWSVSKPTPGVVPSGTKLAMDGAFDGLYAWAGENSDMFSEGMGFLGYPYLAELAQRPEYRRISETYATEMTRKWMRLVSTGDEDGGADVVKQLQTLKDEYKALAPDDIDGANRIKQSWLDLIAQPDLDKNKTDKLKIIEAELKRLGTQTAFRRAKELDGEFGRAHIYLDSGDTDNRAELMAPIEGQSGQIISGKIKKDWLQRLTVVEATWTYPNQYNSNDPLKPDYFKPTSWFVMGKEVHSSRLLTFVGREVPDLLKPAYQFGGLSMSQMAKPYVDNWLRTRQSVSDAVSNFSIMVLLIDMGRQILQGGAEALKNRADLFNVTRDNKGLMLADKNTEDLKNVSMPLSGLDELQAQALEHICSATAIPLVKYTGIAPSGLNASSDGEIRCWYDVIEAAQEAEMTDKLVKIINIIQLEKFGEIDPEIGFMWEPLWSLNKLAAAQVRKTDAETDVILINGAVISPQESRVRLAADEDSPYASLDLDEEIEGPDPNEELSGETETDPVTPNGL
jgi:uncharacterized protein